MALEIEVEENPQSETIPAHSPAPVVPQESERNKTIYHIVGLSSLGLMGSFFLPWIKFLMATPSGYDLQQIPSEEAKLIWIIPITALLALVATIIKKGVSSFSQIAGAMPFLALMYYRVKLGAGFFQILQIGAYLSLALAAILFVAPRFLEKSKSR